MKKASAKKNNNDLRPEYDLSKLKGGVRGKYYRQATGRTDLIQTKPEIINSDSESAELEDEDEHIQCRRNNVPNG
jgi:hypothetical protein